LDAKRLSLLQPLVPVNGLMACARRRLAGRLSGQRGEFRQVLLVREGYQFSTSAESAVEAYYAGNRVGAAVDAASAVLSGVGLASGLRATLTGAANGLLAPATRGAAAEVTQAEVDAAIRSVPTHYAPRMTQWGWTGSNSWNAAVREVASGGEGGILRTVGGHVPTYEEAVQLIQKAGGTIVRVEGPHAAGGGVAGHINFNHINYTTAGGVRSHLAIQALPAGS
jgi:hypothetical protein